MSTSIYIYLLTNVGVDTAENESSKISPKQRVKLGCVRGHAPEVSDGRHRRNRQQPEELDGRTQPCAQKKKKRSFLDQALKENKKCF